MILEYYLGPSTRNFSFGKNCPGSGVLKILLGPGFRNSMVGGCEAEVRVWLCDLTEYNSNVVRVFDLKGKNRLFKIRFF